MSIELLHCNKMTGYLKKPIENYIRLKKIFFFKSLCLLHPPPPPPAHVLYKESLGFASGGIYLKPRVSITKQVVGILEHVPDCFSRV